MSAISPVSNVPAPSPSITKLEDFFINNCINLSDRKISITEINKAAGFLKSSDIKKIEICRVKVDPSEDVQALSGVVAAFVLACLNFANHTYAIPVVLKGSPMLQTELFITIIDLGMKNPQRNRAQVVFEDSVGDYTMEGRQSLVAYEQ